MKYFAKKLTKQIVQLSFYVIDVYGFVNLLFIKNQRNMECKYGCV
jgi:hypothetical protein